MSAPAAWWCHVCMRPVPVSEVATHRHDRGKAMEAWEYGPDAARWKP